MFHPAAKFISLLAIPILHTLSAQAEEPSQLHERVKTSVGSVSTYKVFSVWVPEEYANSAADSLSDRGFKIDQKTDPMISGDVGIFFRSSEPQKTGTSFIYNDDMITNCHVINGGDHYVEINGERIETIEKQVDHHRDLCVIEPFQDDVNFQSFKWSSRTFESINEGEDVYILGNPLGLQGTFSSGMVSARRVMDDTRMIQVTAPSSPGSSGSPVFDGEGLLIGVLTSQMVGGQNLNFAVSADHLEFIEQHDQEYNQFLDGALDLNAAAATINNASQESIKMGWVNQVGEMLKDYSGYKDHPSAIELQVNSLIFESRFNEALMLIDSHQRQGGLTEIKATRLKINALEAMWKDNLLSSHMQGENSVREIAQELIQEYRQFRKFNPFDFGVNAELAIMLSDKGKHSDALQVLDDTFSVHDSQHEALYASGMVYSSKENWERSLYYCQSAVEQRDQYSQGWSCIAKVAQQLGRQDLHDEAAAELRAMN